MFKNNTALTSLRRSSFDSIFSLKWLMIHCRVYVCAHTFCDTSPSYSGSWYENARQHPRKISHVLNLPSHAIAFWKSCSAKWHWLAKILLHCSKIIHIPVSLALLQLVNLTPSKKCVINKQNWEGNSSTYLSYVYKSGADTLKTSSSFCLWDSTHTIVGVQW